MSLESEDVMKNKKEAFQEFVNDPRYEVYKNKINIDKDNRQYELQFCFPGTAKGSYQITSGLYNGVWPAWNNNGALHYIEVDTGSDFKANMKGSYIQISYIPIQIRLNTTNPGFFAGAPIQAIDQVNLIEGWSLPWNAVSNFFQTVSLKGNQSRSVIEQYVNQNKLQHISTQRYLLNYTSDALENGEQFFNPCIESDFDNLNGLSVESFERANKWLGRVGLDTDVEDTTATATNNKPKRFTKCIPLSDIFECCNNPGIFNNLNKFRFEFTLKMPNEIAFRAVALADMPADLSEVYIIIDDISLILDTTRMTQLRALENLTEKTKGTLENLPYLQNDVISWNYTPGSQIVATSVRDAQLVTFGVPAIGNIPTDILGLPMLAVCVNPIQYYSPQITSVSLTYGNELTPIKTPLRLGDGLMVAGNVLNDSVYSDTTAYMLYKKACCSDLAQNIPPALSYVGYRQYHIFFFPLYNQTYLHRNSEPNDVRINNTSNGANVPFSSIILIRKLAGTQINSNGDIEKL